MVSFPHLAQFDSSLWSYQCKFCHNINTNSFSKFEMCKQSNWNYIPSNQYSHHNSNRLECIEFYYHMKNRNKLCEFSSPATIATARKSMKNRKSQYLVERKNLMVQNTCCLWNWIAYCWLSFVQIHPNIKFIDFQCIILMKCTRILWTEKFSKGGKWNFQSTKIWSMRAHFLERT